MAKGREEGNEGGRRRRSSVIFIASLPNEQGVLITAEKTSARSLCKIFLLLNLTCKYIRKLIPSLYMKYSEKADLKRWV